MNTPVRILADTVKALGIGVSASRDIGGEFQVIDRTDFVHENCARTTSEDNERDTVTENLQEECGEGTVYLAYDYKTQFLNRRMQGRFGWSHQMAGIPNITVPWARLPFDLTVCCPTLASCMVLILTLLAV